jgi:transposase
MNVSGITTKLHLAMTADGHLVEGFLTGGNIHDVSVADALFNDVFGCHILEDKGYDSDIHRDFLRSQNNIPVIPGRKNRKVPIMYDKTLYKMRKNIEIFFGKLKENKRLAMRYDKHDHVFLAFIALASIKIMLRPIIS